MSLENMKKRMLFEGGGKPTSDGRNVTGKLLSFRSALWNSYQAEDITFKNKKFRCLINPDKLKENYDQKEISIDFDANMKNGDVFYWDRTNTHWIAYLQRYEEEAYFRAQIRRCDYELDVDGDKYWVYVRGPVETAIVWRQKHQIEMNDLNYSILLYITKDEKTTEFFNRFQKIKFDGHNWRVAATDKYSQDGLIEVYLEEYFDNEMEDAILEPEIVIPDKRLPYIDGPQIIRAYDTNKSYAIVNASNGEFVVNSSKVKLVDCGDGTCVIDVLTGKSATFDLIYKAEDIDDVILTVTIKSL